MRRPSKACHPAHDIDSVGLYKREDSVDERKYLTSAEQFTDVSRGNPQPHKLTGDALVKARLTPETWRLEIVSDGSTQIEKPRKIEDGTTIDFPTLVEMGKKHGIRFLKAMQCLNIAQP